MGRTSSGEVSYCTECSKRSHRTKKHAFAGRRTLSKSNHKHPGKGGRLMVYRCPHGNGWHIGHSTAAIDAVGG